MASTPARMMRNAGRTTIRRDRTFTATARATTATTAITEGTVTDTAIHRPIATDFFAVMTKASGATVAIVATTATMVADGHFLSNESLESLSSAVACNDCVSNIEGDVADCRWR